MGRAIPMAFESSQLAGEHPPPVTAVGGARSIDVRGGLSVSGVVEDIEAVASALYRTLTLRVVCRVGPETAPRQVVDLAYHARLLDLAPGRYLLLVRHLIILRGPDGHALPTGLTLLEQELHVPPDPELRPEQDARVAGVEHRNIGDPGPGEQ